VNSEMYFSDSYIDARQKFLIAARSRGAEIHHHMYPRRGRENEDLFIDVALVGKPDGRKRLFLVSGTHGVEGLLGSACQTAWLQSGLADKAGGVSVYLIHALNPYGFSWMRRVNEDNVDLNRNFLEFSSGPLPDNPKYRELESLLNPRVLDESSLGKLDPMLKAWFSSAEKQQAFKAAVGQGQYEFPKGIIFGGARASWSNVFFKNFIRSLPTSTEVGVVLDIHTGLGEAGGLEIFTEESGSKFKTMEEWFNSSKLTTVGNPESLGYTISGSLYQGLTSANTDSPWYCAALEFGTRPITDVLLALQADNWLHCFANEHNQLSEKIRGMMKRAFSLETEPLRHQTVVLSLKVIEQALRAVGNV
jgi:hypothetical protein